MFKREINKYKIIEVRDDATITHYPNTKKKYLKLVERFKQMKVTFMEEFKNRMMVRV